MPGLLTGKLSPVHSTRVVCGLEIPREILWKDWSLGKEYTKYIAIKNITDKPQKLKFSTPCSQAFKAGHAKPIFLAPGNVFNLPIIFKPLERVDHLDKMEFSTESGCLSVTLAAPLAQKTEVDVAVPEKMDLGRCAVGGMKKAVFQVTNVSEIDTDVRIDILAPMSVQPSMFRLDGGQTATLCATFHPSLAKIYSTSAVLRYGENYVRSKVIQINGRGEFARLLAFCCSKDCCSSSSRNPVVNPYFKSANDSIVVKDSDKNKKRPVHYSSNNNNNNNNKINNRNNNNNNNNNGDNDKIETNANVEKESKRARKVCNIVDKERNIVDKECNIVDKERNTVVKELNIVDNSNNNNNNGDVRQHQTVLLFGEVSPGGCCKKHLMIKNESTVDTYYSVRIFDPVEEAKTGSSDGFKPEGVFRIDKCYGSIKAQSCQEVTVSFRPSVPGMTYTVELMLQSCSEELTAPGCIGVGSPCSPVLPRTLLRCKGTCSRPNVCLSETVIAFSLVDMLVSSSRRLEIVNQSQCSTYFQFQIDNGNSSFSITPRCGELPARSSIAIVVTFSPRASINYYRKIACLVQHKGVLYLELMGTCQDVDKKPVVLNQAHLTRYNCFLANKMTPLAPKQLSAMFERGDSGIAPVTNFLGKPEQVTTPENEFMDDGHTSLLLRAVPHVSTDVDVVDFGRLDYGCPALRREVCLTNHTMGPITVHWCYCPTRNAFSVRPQRQVVEAERSAVFTFSFDPLEQNQFYSCEFECYATPASFSDYKTTDERVVFPPWCITVTGLGNSFGYGCERFRPELTIERTTLKMSALSRETPVFSTIRFYNKGQTPLTYDLEKDSQSTILHKPSKGLIEPDSHRILLIQFDPNGGRTGNDYTTAAVEGDISRTLKLVVNDDCRNDQLIRIRATVESPRVIFGSRGRLLMRPTCTGLIGGAGEKVTNPCCAPLKFEWIIPEVYSGLLGVEPKAGLLNPYETQLHKWTHSHKMYERKLIKVKLRIVFAEMNSDGSFFEIGREVTSGLTLVTQGSRATIRCRDDRVDLGPLVVGDRVSCLLTEITNDFDCDVYYKLHLRQKSSSCCGDDEDNENSDGDDDDAAAAAAVSCRNRRKDKASLGIEKAHVALLHLHPTSGRLPARTKRAIHCTLDMVDRQFYNWAVSFTLRDENGNQLTHQPEERLLRVSAHGIIPFLSVVDVLSAGGAKCLDRSYMWKSFSIPRLNSKIKTDPGNGFKRFSQSTAGSLDFHFPAGPMGSESCSFVLTFENNGFVPCRWKIFLLPELKLEVDKWAESGQMSGDEYHEMLMLDNELFTISPRSGLLDLGQRCCVTLTFSRLIVGSHVLPVLLKVYKGNEIKINLKGTTVERDLPYLHFPSKDFRFDPVYVGGSQGPVQSFEVFNGGSANADFCIDLSPLQRLSRENYDYDVLECLTPSGCIEAGRSNEILFRFNPIEAKMYSVDLAIQVEGGDTCMINFTGEGKDFRCKPSQSDETCSSISNSSIPDKQASSSPEQMCRLSVDRLSLGDLPMHCHINRLVTLVNDSGQHSTSFSWHVKNPEHSRVLKIEPVSGCLSPGGSTILKVTFRSIGQPSIIKVDLICEVTNLTEKLRHEEEMNLYNKEKDHYMTEVDFSQVDHCQDLNCSRNNLETEDVPLLDDCRKQLALPRYKTLPPILKRDSGLACDPKTTKKLNKYFLKRPKTPINSLLHLEVTARTYDLDEHKKLFPDKYKTAFVDRTLISSGKKEACRGDDKKLDDREYNALSEIMAGLLKNLLEDESFVDSCLALAKEPIPYFRQFVNADKKNNNDDDDDALIPPVDVVTPSADVEASSIPAGRNCNLQQEGSSAEERFSHPSERSEERRQKSGRTQVDDEKTLERRQKMKTSPEFGELCEGLLENTLFNIIVEAYNGEFSVTSRPRLLALHPPQK